MNSKDPNEKLRNFQFPNDVYYDLEYMAEQDNRSAKDQLIHIVKEAAEDFKANNKIKKMPRTLKRKKKLSQGRL